MHRLIAHFQRIAPTWLLLDCGLGGDPAGGAVPAPLLGHRDDRPREMDRGLEAHRQGQPLLGTGSMPGIAAAPSSTGATRARRSLHGAPESASNAASLTSRSDPVRGSARRRASSSAYRKRLSVTPSVTPAPNTAIEPSDSSEVFRYVRHADVPRFAAEGWEPLPALDGTHHGEYSVLMRRVEQG